MNILVPDSWLREYLKTKATPKQITDYLSLSGQSVEKLTQVKDDWLYTIEVTTNRADCLSIYGIARELSAILPRFGIKAKLKKLPEEKIKIPKISKGLPLKVKIKNPSLCQRFTAIIFDKIVLKPSPKIIQERLKLCGIRALNNVVDISNYLMLELGQPMHTFDYDKIKKAEMILRESKKGETIITLDGVKRKLPSGTIIIEDGEGRIIDLCGIMGGKNSEVDEKTRRVLLFIQTYNPRKIRQTCQRLAFRTEAASRFEKGVDPEGVILATKKAITMFQKNCAAKVASKLIDIYPSPQKQKKVVLNQRKLNQIIGIKISLAKAKRTLESLGFRTKIKKSLLEAIVPHWRYDDISLPEDLIEEIARIYGYHNLPSLLPTGDFPQPSFEKNFYWQKKIKHLLKDWGFTETYSYSMQSSTLIQKAGFNVQKCLQIKNPLNQELEYLRTSLTPSLLQIIASNQACFEKIKIFELARIYLPQKNQLPEEKPILAGAITGKDKFYHAKGIVEALLEELGITDYQFFPLEDRLPLWHPLHTALVFHRKNLLGIVGEINSLILNNFEIKSKVTVFNLDLSLIFRLATNKKTYQSIPQYPPVVEHLCFLVKPKTQIDNIIRLIKQTSSIIQSVKLIDSFKNQRTLEIIYQHPKKTLSEQEVKKIREKIIKELERKQKAVLKT